jgi:site-specific recombinase XerD
MQIDALAKQFYEYSKYIKGYSKPTIKRYFHSISFFGRHAGIENIEEVTPLNVRSFFYFGRMERNWTASTFRVNHNCLKVFFRWCVKGGLLPSNPMDDIEMPRLEHKLVSKLTKREAERLLEAAYHYPYKYSFLRYRNHAIFSLFLFAGLRKTELLNLKYDDVDIENMTLLVRQGKGSKDRLIPLSFTLAESLKLYLAERRRLKRTCPEFFCSLKMNVGITGTGLKRLVERIRKQTGINFTLHQLRHTFATLMLEGGCDIFSLSRMMGHSDIKTTTIYLAASAEHLRSQMGKHPLNDFVK